MKMSHPRTKSHATSHANLGMKYNLDIEVSDHMRRCSYKKPSTVTLLVETDRLKGSRNRTTITAVLSRAVGGRRSMLSGKYLLVDSPKGYSLKFLLVLAFSKSFHSYAFSILSPALLKEQIGAHIMIHISL